MREILATHLWPEGERNPGNVGVLLPNWNVRYHNDSIKGPLSNKHSLSKRAPFESVLPISAPVLISALIE